MPSKLSKVSQILVSSNDVQDKIVQNALVKLVSGEYGSDLEKLKGEGIYSLRAGLAFRIVLVKAIINGISSWVVAELLRHHEYEQSKFLKRLTRIERKTFILECINNNAIYVLDSETNLLKERAGTAAPQATVNARDFVEHSGHYITLDGRQRDALLSSEERVIQVVCGEAGSGKTLILMHRIAELARILSTQEPGEEHRRIWVMIPHLALQRHLTQEWSSHSVFSEINTGDLFNSVTIVTPEAFYRQLDNLAPEFLAVGASSFLEWLSEADYITATKNTLFGRISKMRLYQELCILNGLDCVDSYENPELAEIFLATDDRVCSARFLDSLLKRYQDYLAVNNRFDPYLYVAKNTPKQDDYYIGDEAQNLPPRLLGSINELIAMNESQSTLLPRRANEVLLKFMHKNKARSIRYSALEGTYRCPQLPLKLVSNFDELIRSDVNPKSKRATTSGALVSLNAEQGVVSLVGDWSAESSDMTVLKRMVQEPGVAVICLTQAAMDLSARLFPEALCVFGPDNPCTGLEFNRVIVLCPFDSTSASLLSSRVDGLTQNQADEIIQMVANPFKIAATRAMNALVVVQERSHKIKGLIDTLLKDVVLSPLEFIELPPQEKAARFYEQASDLYRQGQHDMAFAIIGHIGGDVSAFKDAMEFRPHVPEPSRPVPASSSSPSKHKPETRPHVETTPNSATIQKPVAWSASAALQPVTPQTPFGVDHLSPETKGKLMSYTANFLTRYSDKNFKSLLAHSHARIILFELKLVNGLCLFSNLLLSYPLKTFDSFFRKEQACATQFVDIASPVLVRDEWLRFLFSKITSLAKHVSPELISWSPSLLLAEKDAVAEEAILGYLIESNAIQQFTPEDLSEKKEGSKGSLLSSFINNSIHANSFCSKKTSNIIINAIFLILQRSPAEGVFIILNLMLCSKWHNKNKDSLVKRLLKFEGLFTQIADDESNKRMSPFYLFCAHDGGHVLLSNYWVDFKERLTSERLFAQVTGDGPNKGASPFYRLCESDDACSLLFNHWDDFRDHLTSEGLFAQVTGDGPDKGTSPFYWLCANNGGRALLFKYWDDFKDRLTSEDLFAQVTADGPDEGTSPFYWLCTSGSGRALLLAHKDYFEAFIPAFKKIHSDMLCPDERFLRLMRIWERVVSPVSNLGIFSKTEKSAASAAVASLGQPKI